VEELNPKRVRPQNLQASRLFANLVLVEYTVDVVTTLGRIIGESGGELPSGFWQIFRWLPHPELAMHVRRYYGYFESSSRVVRRRELPSGQASIRRRLGPSRFRETILPYGRLTCL
jgi:hypothetical protein